MGTLEEILPKVYQLINGEVINIKAKYTLAKTRYQAKDSALVMFLVEAYNPSYSLIIDPYAWATYYGGNSKELPSAITTDKTGNSAITGYTFSTAFPAAAATGYTVFQAGYQGGTALGYGDAFIVKFDPAGTRLWATYYGGSGNDVGYGLATDLLGNIVVTGATSSVTFPVGAIAGNTVAQTSNAGGFDIFLLKFNPLGLRLWATYYGGTGDEYGFDIATDISNNIAITGDAQSLDFPVGATAGNTVFQTACGFAGDACILKFDATGNRLWATYYGGNDIDGGRGIILDGSGNLFVTGTTASTNFPTGAVAGNTVFQAAKAFAGFDYDAFILKFDPTGVRLWATHYGGNGRDIGCDITIDLSGNTVITGYTSATNFPVGAVAGNTVFQSVTGGSYDVFVIKFNSTGARLWATYHGGYRQEWAFRCAADDNGNIYIYSESGKMQITETFL
ncbi:MAG: SBBP repeat-containing protein [Bacteroidetes bacterium]|nr:SBBP repeat-containing protein [Bacteroidota bacterium]